MSVDGQTIEEGPAPRHPYRKDFTPRFDSFLPFVHVADERARQSFLEVLRELFRETGEDWRPGGCRGAEYLNRVVRQLQTNGKLTGIQFAPMSYGGGAHFYLTATMNEGGEPLIIDPYGVPPVGVSEEVWMRDPKVITPYFGDLESAPERHKRVYSTGEPIEGKGFHIFRP